MERLAEAVSRGETVVRFGQHHHSHAVCCEDGMFRVRALEVAPEARDAYLQEHGIFMAEHAEQISQPRTVIFEAPSFEALVSMLSTRWPL